MEVQFDQVEPAWVHAGSVLRAHGVHGALRVRFDISPSELTGPLKAVRVVPRRGVACVMQLEDCRDVHGGALVVLAGIKDRDAAQLLAGAALEVDETLVPAADPDDAYVYELVGAHVRDAAGQSLGQITRVADNAGQSLLVMRDDAATERLLPLVPETFCSFDRASRVLTVNVPAGLWE